MPERYGDPDCPDLRRLRQLHARVRLHATFCHRCWAYMQGHRKDGVANA